MLGITRRYKSRTCWRDCLAWDRCRYSVPATMPSECGLIRESWRLAGCPHPIDAVGHTLFEELILVVMLVIVFLQTLRASIIPLAAVPVSLIGTFAGMLALGFYINALSLFGLVLAIGIVVDDAIVVVENVERNIHLGLSPRDATNQAMKEVTGPIIATPLG